MRILLALLVMSAVAHAADKRPRIGVLEVSIEGDAPPELRGQIGKSLGGGIYAGGYDVVDRDDVAARLRGARALVGCVSTTCLGKIATLLGARKLVRVRALATGAAYSLELELYTPDGLENRLERSCPVCTLREVNDLVSKAALELVSGKPQAPEPARVVIVSRPDGARVEVDGAFVGNAPVEADLEPGPHRFHASVPAGFRAADAQRTLIGGERAEVVLALTAEPPPVAPAPAETHRYGGWKWAAAGASVALLAGGAAMLALDGGTTDCTPGSPCMDVYATKGLGIGGLALGAALGGLATYLFVTDRVEIAPTGLAHITARVRF